VLLKTVSFLVRSTLLCSAHRTHKRGHAETRGWSSQTEERNNRRWCRQYVRNFELLLLGCVTEVLPKHTWKATSQVLHLIFCFG